MWRSSFVVLVHCLVAASSSEAGGGDGGGGSGKEGKDVTFKTGDVDVEFANQFEHDAWVIRTTCPSAVPASFSKTLEKNRKILGSVERWIAPEDYKNSIFRYGLEDAIPKINNPVGPKPIISDFLAAAVPMVAATSKDAAVHYIEIGVSFGKTFLQVLNALDEVPGSDAFGFDIEDINPTLVKLLGNGVETRTLDTWQLKTDPRMLMRKGRPGTLTEFLRPNNKTPVRYLAGDVNDNECYEKIQRKFNLIYSDALHEDFGVLSEFNNLVKNKLMDEENGFAIFWDDLEVLQYSFHSICNTLTAKYPGSACSKTEIHGWLGVQERLHTVGLFTTEQLFDIHCLLQQVSTKH